MTIMGSGTMVASNARGQWFESSHQQNFISDIYLFPANCIEKTKIKGKEAGNGPFLAKLMTIMQSLYIITRIFVTFGLDLFCIIFQSLCSSTNPLPKIAQCKKNSAKHFIGR